MRNTMHNRVVADVFVPAGGRPNTVDINNYKQFMQEDGTPTSRLIVEGANLFITAAAREKLFNDHGIKIVKDSSANKAGVICSSYEIMCAMMLSEQEFLDNKEEIIADVLVKLKHFAKVEADLLFREFDNYPGALTHFSATISDTINDATDAVNIQLQSMSDEEVNDLTGVFKSHMPTKIADMAWDRLLTNVPRQYIIAGIASTLASKIVYSEGVNFVRSQPADDLAKIALRYIAKEKEVALLEKSLEAVEGMDEDEKAQILEILKKGGVRTSLTL